MNEEGQQTILIVEDDADLAEMLSAYFSVQGYRVITTAWGEQALTLAADHQPDLVVLDIRLPDIDGFEVCDRLRASHVTRAIPVIFLTEVRERPDRLYGLQMGVVDYITKPFDVQELRLRVRNTLRRAASAGAENPVTGLPEGAAVDALLSEVGAGERPGFGLLSVALHGLAFFRELYGFVASDDVLRVVSLSIATAADEIGGEQAFCGHLDAHTFLIALPATHVAALMMRINERLGGLLEYFYPGDNRAPNARTGDRLRLEMIRVMPGDGPFAEAADLKARLLAAQEEPTPPVV